MISERDFNDATARKRNKMRARLGEKLWKSGKRAGQVRRHGQQLPFTLAEFRAWVMERIGMGQAPCYYCPRMIDVRNFQPDHYEPLELGGGHGLENLRVACEDCNRIKGAMPPQDFIALMEFLDTRLSQRGRDDVKKRLRSGAMGLRLRHQGVAPKKPPQPVAVTQQEVEF